MIYLLGKYIILPFYWLLFRPKIIGRENLVFTRGGIILSNHCALSDPLFIAMCSPCYVHFMAKAELFKTKLSAWLYKQLMAFPVNRNSCDLKSVRNACSLIEKGKVFGIFPEGTRSVTEKPDIFEKGVAYIAASAKTVVVPVFIVPGYRFPKRRTMLVGKPIDVAVEYNDITTSLATKLLHERLQNEMQKLYTSAKETGLL